MRKLLPIFAAVLLLSAASTATSIDYDTGIFASGTFAGTFSNTINVSVTGSLHTIDIQTGMLVQTTLGCPVGASCFNFTGGSVTVDGTLFTDALNGGVTIREDGAASISATLMPETGVAGGTASASFVFDDGNLKSGSEDVAYNTSAVPEPSSLMLLGTGIIGVVAYRKHRRKET